MMLALNEVWVYLTEMADIQQQAADLQQDADSLHCQMHQGRWFDECLDFYYVGLVQRIKCSNGSF